MKTLFESMPRGLFEVHIAAEQAPYEKICQVMDGLTKEGIALHDLFIKVTNLGSQPSMPAPGGHDLATPGLMSTAHTTAYDNAKELVFAGMNVLDNYKINGNFEIERVLMPDVPDQSVDIADFPAYEAVPDSPVYENHFIWSDTKTFDRLPTIEQMVAGIENSYGVKSHQVVDFIEPTKEQVTSRVVTIYQPNRVAALSLVSRLWTAPQCQKPTYAIAEQVCLVGQRIKPI